MNRRLLGSVMALGTVITLVGAAGIFAVFTDRATTGTNSVTSGARASAADVQIAPVAIGSPTGCGTFVENLATGLFTITDAQPTGGGPLEFESICLKNAGSADLAYSTAVIDLTDVETACTGDEAAAGDTSCTAGLTGELAPVLVAEIAQVDCFTGTVFPGTGTSGTLTALANAPGGAPLGVSAAPNAVVCLRLGISYPTSTSDTQVQIAQSDQVTWRFAFDGTTPS